MAKNGEQFTFRAGRLVDEGGGDQNDSVDFLLGERGLTIGGISLHLEIQWVYMAPCFFLGREGSQAC